MLYSEFIENTGAADNEYNYQVYKNLEALYMVNDRMTKNDVYAAAKSLIDNSKEEEARQARVDEINAEIDEINSVINHYKERIETYKTFIEISTPEEVKEYKKSIKAYRLEIKKEQNNKSRYKFLLSII